MTDQEKNEITEVCVCNGRSCSASFSQYTKERAITEAQTKKHIEVSDCGCLGLCEQGPNVLLKKPNQEPQKKIGMNPIAVTKLIKQL